MTVFQKNQKLNIESADGIWLDYKDHHWIYFLKDRVLDKEELQRVNKSDIHISFIQKGIVDAFLLEIYDCLETSDIPFCIKDGDDTLLASLKDAQDYTFEVVILDEANVVLASREVLLPHQDSAILKQRLLKRLSEDFDGDAFDKAYASLVNKFEPKNTGMAWSMLSGKQAFLSIVSAAAIGVMIYYVLKKDCSKLMKIALALMIGGAAGSLVDGLF